MHKVTYTCGKPFECFQCDKGFSQTNGLMDHILKHIGENTNQRGLCNKIHSSNSDLKVHMVNHYGEESLECWKCSLERRIVAHTD